MIPEQTAAEVEAIMARWWDRMSQQKRDQWVALGVIYAIGSVLNEMPEGEDQ